MNSDFTTRFGGAKDNLADPTQGDGIRHQEPGRGTRGLPSPAGWVLIGFLAISAFFLLSEHRAHFLGALPWLLLLACPLLHFLHGGHGYGGHGDHESHGSGQSDFEQGGRS